MNKSEEKFKEWLDSKKYPYIYVDQGTDTFSNFFKDFTKRPDFLVIVRNFGIIAVDVKEKNNREYKDFILDEEEVKKYLAFERITKLPVWFVFCRREEEYKNWYWISLSKVLECSIKKSQASGDEFRAINSSDCIIIQVGRGDGLSRLMDDMM
ncbi:hypothetical protein [Hippea alviniae]|uniref:hypothetical protein n=1 Tax=Hippea alviniae TaxID=1279027 RepID=UPI0003B5F6EC|nr:hypothetical protein [Hippea alviniae]